MFNLGTFKDLISVVDLVSKSISSWVKRARGRKRKLLLELQCNVELIFSYGRYDLPIDDVIANLQTAQVEAALESDYNLNLLKKGEVTKRTAGKEPHYQQYVGWTTERLFTNLYVKIKDLQTIIKIDPHNENIRKRVRLINILKQMLLLTKHINA
jgi:hypothetical protein